MATESGSYVTDGERELLDREQRDAAPCPLCNDTGRVPGLGAPCMACSDDDDGNPDDHDSPAAMRQGR